MAACGYALAQTEAAVRAPLTPQDRQMDMPPDFFDNTSAASRPPADEPVHRRWSLLGGGLVFDFSIACGAPRQGLSTASVNSSDPPADARLVDVATDATAPAFSFRFPSGCYVSGKLRQVPVHIDGVANAAIFANIRYGIDGQGEAHRFEGIVAACPMPGAAFPQAVR